MTIEQDNNIFCKYSSSCAGCGLMNLSLQEEINFKRQEWEHNLESYGLFNKTSDIQIIHDQSQVDHRIKIDFGLESGRVGLWNQELKKIIDIPDCLVLHPELQKAYEEFRKFDWSWIKRGSFRIRISPSLFRQNNLVNNPAGHLTVSAIDCSEGNSLNADRPARDKQIGLWLDFSHQDIQALLQKDELCLALSEYAYVEIGQRFKKLIFDKKQNRYKLADPELHFWFTSIILQQPFDFYCYVGSFSQPSFYYQVQMNQKLEQWFDQHNKLNRIFEYGCGFGNWTMTLAKRSSVQKIFVTESDQRSLSALRKNIEFGMKEFSDLPEKIEILDSRYHQNTLQLPDQLDLVLVNPSRDGLGQLTKTLQTGPEFLIYISCYPQTLLADMEQLKSVYSLKESVLVNQFPRTKHYEIMTFWQRRGTSKPTPRL